MSYPILVKYLTVTGWVIEQTETMAVVASMVQTSDGTVTAEGRATAVKPPDHFRHSVDIETDRKYWQVDDD